jgi:hypothetical protein
MKTRALVFLAIATILLIGTGLVWGYTESGSNNFFGTGAGANTSGGGSGSEDDTFIGASAGIQNTSGVENTFLGVGAGYYNNGNNNTFLGWSAGNQNTTGNNNTFVGWSAGNNNSTGYFNTFLGFDAGFSNTTGAGNIFIGYQAGVNNSTASNNTFIGDYAGYSNSTGYFNTFLGDYAGASNTTGYANTFLGDYAGYFNAFGGANTFIGESAGDSNSTGYFNTFLGFDAGYHNTTGNGNVFLGSKAGYNETGSDRLYIDNCYTGASCDSPLIYGEFDNRILKIDGKIGIKTKPLYPMDVSGNGVSKSQMHFSIDGTDTGGWITSYNVNHFWLSSGAVWDYPAGGWIEKSPDGKAVMAGSGGLGYRILFSSGVPVGGVLSPTVRFHIDYSGNFGINTSATSGKPINTATTAYLSSGGVWVNASSRELKENIKELSSEKAMEALSGLNPVTFNYKADSEEKHVGFIAEDVPDLVATKDRKGLSPMDIVAVLTKVVQEERQTLEEKSKVIEHQQQSLEEQRQTIEAQQKTFDNLVAAVARLQA